MMVHVKATIPGVVGNCATGAGWLVAWLTKEFDPIAHSAAIAFAALASAATFGYYGIMSFVQWRDARRKRRNGWRPRRKKARAR